MIEFFIFCKRANLREDGMRRWISLAVVLAMFTPAAALAAEGTMAAWLAPQPGQIVSGTRVEVAVGFNTWSDLKVTSLELYVDSQFYVRKILGAPATRGVCSFWWDVSREEQGTHNLVVKVFAGDQLISKVYGTGTVGPNGQSRGIIDTRPPVVTFANIKSQDVLKGTTTVKINAVDDSGEPPMVSLLIDNVLKLVKNTPPYSYDLDTTTYPDGEHALKTYAYDGAGNQSEPEVINVTFRNDAPKTAVAAQPKQLQEGEMPAEYAGDILAPDLTPIKEPSAAAVFGRSVAKNTDENYTIRPAAVVKATEAAKPVELPKAVAIAVPKTISTSVKQALRPSQDAPKPEARMASAMPVTPTAPVMPAAPAIAKNPVKMASASSLPVLRIDSLSPAVSTAAPVAGKPTIETKLDSPAKAAQSMRVIAAVESAAVRNTPQALVPKNAVSAEPIILDSPSSSSMVEVIGLVEAAGLKQKELSPANVSDAISTAPVIVEPAMVSPQALKRVQVAIAPNLHSATGKPLTSSAIASPPGAAKIAPARIEKTAKPATGKVKARTFFEDMGGVLFWDSSTRTITAYVGDVVFEMRIGSKIAKVNGEEMMMDSAPSLVGDRTIFDAANYAKACAQFQKSNDSKVAQLN